MFVVRYTLSAQMGMVDDLQFRGNIQIQRVKH